MHFIDILKKIGKLLTPAERRVMLALFSCILVTAFLEVAGVASVMPFMAVVANPSLILNNQHLLYLGQLVGLGDSRSFVLFLGAVALFLLVAGNLFAAFTTSFLVRTGARLNQSISSRLLAAYLYRPYELLLRDNSARLNRNILQEVNTVIFSVINPALFVTTRIVSACSIVILLILIKPLLSLAVVMLLGGCYTLIYLMVRKILKWNGERYHAANRELACIVAEALGGVMEIKISGRESEYLNRFNEPARRVAKGQTIGGVVPLVPRYLMEMVAFGGVILLVLFFISTGREITAVLPLITLYAVAGYRLMPSLQQAFSGITQMRFSLPSLERLCRDLAEAPVGLTLNRDNSSIEPLRFQKEIRMEGVTYCYPGASGPALEQLTFAIPANSIVAIVGESGAGKSTLVGLMLGLLTIQEGEMLIDGISVDRGNATAWQRNIGYVPQSIFLSDDTITGNIAFGVPADRIDRAAVQQAAQMANLHRFIESELPEGYDTVVGERGVRLSGGQRQRIGIARALYHDPKLLVMDEATSSLDGITENAVFEAIQNLGHRKTIILIAHRFTTIRDCDRIYMLDRGRIVAQGTYDELMDKCPRFVSMSGSQ